MQPSGPNRPIELPSHLNAAPSSDGTARSTKPRLPKSTLHSPKDPAGWPGGHRKVDTPDPIPNSAVKHLSAHGTVAQATGESVAAGPPSRILATLTRHTHTTTAGWSSPVARQAHNLKVTGSNPVPASKHKASSHNGIMPKSFRVSLRMRQKWHPASPPPEARHPPRAPKVLTCSPSAANPPSVSRSDA
jgi:hypothetical protein